MNKPQPKTKKRLRAGFRMRHKKACIRVYVSKRSALGKACLNRNSYDNFQLKLLGPLYDRFSFRLQDKELYAVWLRPFRSPGKLEIFAEFNLKHRDRLLSGLAGRLAHEAWAKGAEGTETSKGRVYVKCVGIGGPFGKNGVVLAGSNSDPKLLLGNCRPISAPFIYHSGRTPRTARNRRHGDA